MFPQGILTHPTCTFHVDHEHLPQILKRSSLSIAQYGFSEHPHTRHECRPHLLFFIPFFHLPSQSSRRRTRSLVRSVHSAEYYLCARFIRYVVLPEFLQDVLPCCLGFVIHSVVGPRSACHDFHQAFSSTPRHGIDKLWFIVARFNHHFCIHEPKHALCFAPKAAIVSKGRISISPAVSVNGTPP